MTKVTNITPSELKKICSDDSSAVVIDVREQHEWDEVHMSNARHVPMKTLLDKITEIVPNKDTPILLHCKGGVRSMQCAENIAKLGYRKVYSLDGGINAWQNAGYPVIKK